VSLRRAKRKSLALRHNARSSRISGRPKTGARPPQLTHKRHSAGEFAKHLSSPHSSEYALCDAGHRRGLDPCLILTMTVHGPRADEMIE